MKLETQDVIDQPVDTVYKTVRDDLVSLVPYLPNVAKIEIESQSAGPKGAQIVNRWFAKAELPTLLKKFVKPELMSWIDRAQWDDQAKIVTYSLESPLGRSLFTAKGINYFEAAGDGKTTLRVTCEIDLYPENLPGVPKLMAGKVKPLVEGLLKKMLEPNLTSLSTGLKGYYQDR